MTATPIPRTLALTYYGDLDVVVLDELPKGRRPDRDAGRADRGGASRRPTTWSAGRSRPGGRRSWSARPSTRATARRSRPPRPRPSAWPRGVFPDLRVDLLHGRMRPKDKEAVMDGSARAQADLLISTTVIEVGVDVPNASVMLVENAERFGLAQLHQLRGRIGRGRTRLVCILFDEIGRGEPGGPGPHRRDGAHHRRVRAGRRGSPAPRRGHAVRHEAVRDARSEARPAGRGRGAGRGPVPGRSHSSRTTLSWPRIRASSRSCAHGSKARSTGSSAADADRCGLRERRSSGARARRRAAPFRPCSRRVVLEPGRPCARRRRAGSVRGDRCPRDRSALAWGRPRRLRGSRRTGVGGDRGQPGESQGCGARNRGPCRRHRPRSRATGAAPARSISSSAIPPTSSGRHRAMRCSSRWTRAQGCRQGQP